MVLPVLPWLAYPMRNLLNNLPFFFYPHPPNILAVCSPNL